MEIENREIEISYYKSSGPGGQKKNVTESAVRIRHLPTGIIVVSAGSRSQHANRRIALEELGRRLAERNKRKKRRIATRPSLGSRTRRIETKKKRGTIKKLRGRVELD